MYKIFSTTAIRLILVDLFEIRAQLLRPCVEELLSPPHISSFSPMEEENVLS